MGTSLDTIISQLDAKFKFSDSSATAEEQDEERDSLEYFFYKFKYSKAKMLRKTRMHQAADDTCQELIDIVRAKMPKQMDPTRSTPGSAQA